MELPIFRELESAWFRAHRPARPPAPAGDAAGPAETAEFAAVRAGSPASGDRSAARTGSAVGTAAMGDTMRGDSGQETPGGGPGAADSWRTVADDGWRAASSAAETTVQETTAAGLPKRRPMAQLVPGGVDRGPSSAQHRSPEAVRGLLSAYHRGVQRGREQMTDDDPDGADGSPSTPAGKERGT
jgi:hypothetical protein